MEIRSTKPSQPRKPSLKACSAGAALLLALVLPGCSDSSGVSSCGTSSGFRAVTGEQVTFLWTNCAMGSIAVLDPDGRVMWSIGGSFESPTIYGIVPSGAQEEREARNLQAGTEYTAFSGVGSTSTGIATFTP